MKGREMEGKGREGRKNVFNLFRFEVEGKGG